MSAPRTPFCGHCKNIGKTEREYTSHYSHKTQSQNSPLTCPELLKKVCTRCASRNHTFDKCKNQSVTKPLGPAIVKPAIQKASASLNKYSELSIDDESDNDTKSEDFPIIEFNMDTLYWLDPKEQVNFICEQIYARLIGQYNIYTCKIVGMFLEFDASEIIELLVKPDLLKEYADEALDLLIKDNYKPPKTLVLF